jgi:hypothetical protein
MRKALPFLVVVALAGTAILAVSAGGASGSSDGAAFEPWARQLTRDAARATGAAESAAAGERLVILARSDREKFVDADGSGGPSVGDYFLFTERIVNGDGALIGRDWGSCTLQFGQAAQCEATIRLFGRGTIEVAGTIGRHPFIPITGGTGEFADAGGELNVANERRLVGTLIHLAD